MSNYSSSNPGLPESLPSFSLPSKGKEKGEESSASTRIQEEDQEKSRAKKISEKSFLTEKTNATQQENNFAVASSPRRQSRSPVKKPAAKLEKKKLSDDGGNSTSPQRRGAGGKKSRVVSDRARAMPRRYQEASSSAPLGVKKNSPVKKPPGALGAKKNPVQPDHPPTVAPIRDDGEKCLIRTTRTRSMAKVATTTTTQEKTDGSKLTSRSYLKCSAKANKSKKRLVAVKPSSDLSAEEGVLASMGKKDTDVVAVATAAEEKRRANNQRRRELAALKRLQKNKSRGEIVEGSQPGGYIHTHTYIYIHSKAFKNRKNRPTALFLLRWQGSSGDCVVSNLCTSWWVL